MNQRQKIGKEDKGLHYFTNGMIVYIKNLKDNLPEIRIYIRSIRIASSKIVSRGGEFRQHFPLCTTLCLPSLQHLHLILS